MGANYQARRDINPSVTYRRHVADPTQLAALIEELCDRLLPQRPERLLADRLPLLTDLDLFVAEDGDRIVGFKLGYRTALSLYFSWLGAVDPAYRRRGIASYLTVLQHEFAKSLGVTEVETRTRSSNSAMLIVNLQAGFRIVGVEADPYDRFIVLLRKFIGGSDEA